MIRAAPRLDLDERHVGRGGQIEGRQLAGMDAAQTAAVGGGEEWVGK